VTSIKKDHMFKWKHYQPDIILIAVNYYCRFSLSYRDVSEILKERGVSVVPPYNNHAFGA